MGKKLQQFFIFKLDTERLKDSNYDIELNLNQARKNGELVSIGDSQMLRSLRKLTGKEKEIEQLPLLLEEKHKLKKKIKSSYDLYNLEVQIDEILFVPEIISVVVKNIKHYEDIIHSGLFVNNKRYVRLMCSAGQARRNSVLFIDSNYEKQLKKVLNNDRDDIEITPAKFNAYFALASSTALPVSTPYFCVIPDCEVDRNEKVEWISETVSKNDSIEICDKEIKFNLFDGQGIISPRMAKQWAEELELDYIPSCFIIRSNFIKGMVATIDFNKFSDEVGIHLVKDIYGNEVNIRDMDVILTASQFKLWNAFASTQDYLQKCRKNELGWGITRVTPKEEKHHTFLNYQFIQALKLDNEQIASLCKKTLDYFAGTMSNNYDYTLLYLLGEQLNGDYDKDIFYKIGDNVTKAIILNHDLVYDDYIQSYIQHSLNKRIKESYIGNLLVDGQYTMMVSDPYAFMQHLFGLPVEGLLKRDEHYNHYWKSRGFDKIAGMRSPLTWRSEVDVLHLKDSSMMNEWYEYLHNCCIFNVHGVDMALLGGGDVDGDIICLTNQKEVVEGAYGGLPLMYETKKAPKTKIIESELYKADISGFNTKVGFLTNLSTTMYAMLPLYEEGSDKHQEIIRRLKQCRKEQGAIIDATKGLEIRPIPGHWTNWQKNEDGDPEITFENSLLIEKRPQFMQHLYHTYSKKYLQHFNNYNAIAIGKFNLGLKDLMALEELSMEQQNLLDTFYRFNPLLDSSCEMNRLSKYMQNKIKEIKNDGKTKNDEILIRFLKNPNFVYDDKKYKELYNIYSKYKAGKRNFDRIQDESGNQRFKTIEQYSKAIRQEALMVSSDICELATIAVILCYETYKSDNKSFAWNVFGDGIIENIRLNGSGVIEVPFLDKDGDIEYLGLKYKRKEISLDNEDSIYFL